MLPAGSNAIRFQSRRDRRTAVARNTSRSVARDGRDRVRRGIEYLPDTRRGGVENVKLLVWPERQFVRPNQTCLNSRTTVPVESIPAAARYCRDHPTGHFADAMVARISDVQAAIRTNLDAYRRIQSRAFRGSAITRKSSRPLPATS